MVPVPEEHVKEAMEMILRLARRAELKDWDQAAITTIFHDVDEPTRSVMSAVARASLAKGNSTDVEVAETIEFTQREVLGIVRELNERVGTAGYPVLVTVTMQSEKLPNGRTRDMRMLHIDPVPAAFVREAERAELQATPHPLLSERE